MINTVYKCNHITLYSTEMHNYLSFERAANISNGCEFLGFHDEQCEHSHIEICNKNSLMRSCANHWSSKILLNWPKDKQEGSSASSQEYKGPRQGREKSHLKTLNCSQLLNPTPIQTPP
jgi:hypothetical protein